MEQIIITHLRKIFRTRFIIECSYYTRPRNNKHVILLNPILLVEKATFKTEKPINPFWRCLIDIFHEINFEEICHNSPRSYQK